MAADETQARHSRWASWAPSWKLPSTPAAGVDAGRRLLKKVRRRGGLNAAHTLGHVTTQLAPNKLEGLCGIAEGLPLTAENMIFGYTQGLFPWDANGRLEWHCPDPRFVLFLDELRLSPKMRRDLRKADYRFTFDQRPREVLDRCAVREGGTWLSERLKQGFLELFDLGAMHSVEAWRGDTLVGGSFGLSIGRVWTGETMFHSAPDAGKAQFVALAQHLQRRGYRCVDGQAFSNHFARFGAREISLEVYRSALGRGLAHPTTFYGPGESADTVVPSLEVPG